MRGSNIVSRWKKKTILRDVLSKSAVRADSTSAEVLAQEGLAASAIKTFIALDVVLSIKRLNSDKSSQ